MSFDTLAGGVELIHKTILTDRGEVHYWVEYNGNPDALTIVFTHGMTASHEMFEKQVPFFREKYSLVLWDVPLHGKSNPYSDFSFENCANDLNEILENEGIKRVILVGASMGGYVSQKFIAKFPEKVLAFVSMDSAPLWKFSDYDKVVGTYMNKGMKMLDSKTRKRMMARSVSRTKYTYDKMSEMLRPFTIDEINEQIDAARKSLSTESGFVKIDVPVLLVVGRFDVFGKILKYNIEWADESYYPLIIIENAAHLSNMDNPTDVNNAIEKFISLKVLKS